MHARTWPFFLSLLDSIDVEGKPERSMAYGRPVDGSEHALLVVFASLCQPVDPVWRGAGPRLECHFVCVCVSRQNSEESGDQNKREGTTRCQGHIQRWFTSQLRCAVAEELTRPQRPSLNVQSKRRLRTGPRVQEGSRVCNEGLSLQRQTTCLHRIIQNHTLVLASSPKTAVEDTAVPVPEYVRGLSLPHSGSKCYTF